MKPGKSVPPLSVRGDLPRSAIVPSLRTVAGLRGPEGSRSTPAPQSSHGARPRPSGALPHRSSLHQPVSPSRARPLVGEKVTWYEHGDSMQDREYSRWTVAWDAHAHEDTPVVMATTQSVNHSQGANRDRCIPGARGVTRTAHGACWIALSVTSPSSRDESTGAPPTTTRSAWVSSVTSSCGCARSSRLITRTEGRVSVSRLVPAASTARPRARAASIPRFRSPNDTGTPCTSRSVSSSAAAQLQHRRAPRCRRAAPRVRRRRRERQTPAR
jgi:hypothetical protein